MTLNHATILGKLHHAITIPKAVGEFIAVLGPDERVSGKGVEYMR